MCPSVCGLMRPSETTMGPRTNQISVICAIGNNVRVRSARSPVKATSRMNGGPFNPHNPPKNPQSIPMGTNTGINHLGGTREASGTFSSTAPGFDSATARQLSAAALPTSSAPGAHPDCVPESHPTAPRCGTDGERPVFSGQAGPVQGGVSGRAAGSALGFDTGGWNSGWATASCGVSGQAGSPSREELRLFAWYCRACTNPLVQIFSNAKTRNKAARPNRTSSAGTFSRTKFPIGEVLVILTLNSNPGLQYSLQSL
mmetsp:Transcript_94489/g.252800  ORF Transcript_94489/g.252800 Transcript_94489/m.252800 type:complete len:257 (+) Transcript_94489:396-1166(+)